MDIPGEGLAEFDTVPGAEGEGLAKFDTIPGTEGAFPCVCCEARNQYWLRPVIHYKRVVQCLHC